MIYSSSDIECDRLKLVIVGHFVPSYPPPPKTPQKTEFWKNEKKCWRYHHFTQMYQKPQSYEVHLLRYRVRQTEFFVIMDHSLPFHPPNITIIRCMLPEKWNMTHIIFCHFGPFFAFLPHYWSQKQNLGMLKKPGDIILLHMCTINEGHMMYASWNIRHNRQNFFSFWNIFCCFTHLRTWKIKVLKKWKKKTPEDIIILHLQTTNDDHMMYGSWDMEWDGIFIILDYFCSFTPLTTQKTKILKKWKNAHRYYHFTHLYHKWKSCDV